MPNIEVRHVAMDLLRQPGQLPQSCLFVFPRAHRAPRGSKLVLVKFSILPPSSELTTTMTTTPRRAQVYHADANALRLPAPADVTYYCGAYYAVPWRDLPHREQTPENKTSDESPSSGGIKVYSGMGLS